MWTYWSYRSIFCKDEPREVIPKYPHVKVQSMFHPMAGVQLSMRSLCKEEDYAFLETSGSSTEGSTEDKVTLEDDWKNKKEVWACRHLEWEHQEKERLRGIEESKK
ncbi:hypothetical protein AMECASPLE_031004, partial [Ameca splendens]